MQYIKASHLEILENTSKLVKEEILNGSLEIIKDILQSLCNRTYFLDNVFVLFIYRRPKLMRTRNLHSPQHHRMHHGVLCLS